MSVKFSDLGVVGHDGKQVFLSPNNIATVLGATGGVAPTKFQAATEGFFNGLNQGQNAVQSVSNIQAQQSGIRAQDARTEAIQLQTETQQQTQQAEILQTNNEAQAGALTAQIQTSKLESTNQVLQAIRSGNPDQLVEAVSNPATLQASIESDPYVQAAYAKIKAGPGFTPQQQSAFDTYNRTKQIFNQGPLQQQYQEAASGIVGTPEFQQLQTATGLPTNQLLAGMKIGQVNSPLGPQSVLMSADGKAIPFQKPEDVAKLAPFFATRDRLQTGGTYELPIGSPAAPAVGAVQPELVGAQPAGQPLALPGATPTPTAGPADQVVAPNQSASTLPGQNAQGINPNNISPVGTPLQTTIPQLAGFNQTSTVSGDSVAANTIRNAQQLIAASGGRLHATDVMSEATKMSLAQAKLSDKAVKVAGTNESLAQQKINLAQEIRKNVALAAKSELTLGPTGADVFNRAKERIESNINSLVSSDPEAQARNNAIGDVRNNFDSIQSRYKSTIISESGESKKSGDSDFELKIMLNQAPGLDKTPEFNLAVAERLERDAGYLSDETTLKRQFSAAGIDDTRASEYITEYRQQNAPNVYDEATGSFVPNPAKKDAVEWGYNKLGVSIYDVAKDVTKTPAVAPQSAPPDAAAVGSGSATPFAPAQKAATSAFPTPDAKPNTRGVSYDSTPATQTDLRAIADTAKSGGDIRQFQSAGSVPKKLDVATTDLMARVVGAESSGNPDAVSPIKRNAQGDIVTGGVKGLAQVTQATFKETAPDAKKTFGIETTDRTDPLQSLANGTTYMNKMLKQFDGNVDLALAAYNAGPGAVQDALDQSGSTTARASIDTIAPYLPNTQNTAAYVQKIVGNGRVAPDSQGTQTDAQGSPGFFDAVKQAGGAVLAAADKINPLSAGTAYAEENDPNAEKIAAANASDSPELTAKTQAIAGDLQADNPNATQIDISNKPEETPDSTVQIAKAEPSVRNDVPPVSEIQAALQGQTTQAGRAVKFVKDSDFGKWLGSLQNSGAYQAGQNFVNAATFGLYDEGMGTLSDILGFDGKQVQNEIRASEKDFRRTSPKTALISDLLGSIAGGVGGSIMLRSLGLVKGAATATEGIQKATVGSTAADASIQGAVRGAGEGENAGERVFNAGVGGAAGAVLGGAGQAAGNIPVVGNPAVLGATAGAAAGGLSGGQGGDVLTGAVTGAAGGAALGVAAKSPAVQKQITRTVAALNNYKGLQTLGTMIQKIITGKTPAEVVADLTPSEATLMDMTSHMEPAKLKSILEELRKADTDNIPYRLFDSLNDAEINSVLKVIQQIGGSKNNKEVGAKVNQFLAQRSADQITRINDNLGSLDIVEQSARKISSLIKSTQKGARAEAEASTSALYSKAAQETPIFDSPEIQELLTIPYVKEAVNGARKSVEAAMPNAGKAVTKEPESFLGDSWSFGKDSMFAKAQKGEPIIVNGEGQLADNSFEILAQARRNLRSMQESPDFSATEKRDIKSLYERLSSEMMDISNKNGGAFGEANAKYELTLSKVDALRHPTIEAIRDLEGGNVQQGLNKLIGLPPKDLDDAAKALVLANSTPDDPTGSQVTAALKDAARGYIRQKTSSAIEGKNVASRLISEKEWKNLNTLLGDQEAQALKATIDAESKIAKSTAKVSGGSDTSPKLNAQGKLAELSGEGNALGIEGNIPTSAGGIVNRLVNLAYKTFSGSLGEGSPQNVKELADALVLSLPKGIEAAEKVLKAKGLKDDEVNALKDYLLQAEGVIKGTPIGAVTSISGQVNTKKGKKKK